MREMTSAHLAEECQLSPGEVGRAPEDRIVIAATGAVGVEDVSSSPCRWITASDNHCRDALNVTSWQLLLSTDQYLEHC